MKKKKNRGKERNNMVSVAIILVVSLLFIASLLNIVWSHPTRRLLRWFQSLIVSAGNVTLSGSSINISSSSSRSSTPSEERGAQVAKKEASNETKDDKGFYEQRKMLFSTFDRNGDGFITTRELRDSLWGIRIFMSEEEVNEIVVRSDRNRDGTIDFDEFCRLLVDSSMGFGSSNLGDGEVVSSLKEAFNVFDKDGDGLISVEELASVLCSLGLMSEGGNKLEDCKDMIRKVDMDGDGMVSLEEFTRMMMPIYSGKPLMAAAH